MSEVVTHRVKINILEPHNPKQIMDRQVISLFRDLKEEGRRVVGPFEGWTEPPVVPPIAGHLIYVLKARALPKEDVLHVRWLRSNQAMCDMPEGHDFVVVDYAPEKKEHCLECDMRLKARNARPIS